LGSVSRGFERKGTIMIPAGEGVTEDGLMEVVLGAGADDMVTEEGGFTVTCQPAAFSDVCAALEAAGIKFDQENSQVGLVAITTVPVKEVSVAKAVNKFVAALEEHDDVQDVYTNMEIDEAVADQMEE
jgi:transcriptional/translational regulatory protein YebC/TACO1